MDRDQFRRFGLSIYAGLFLLGVVLTLIAINSSFNSDLKSFTLSLAASIITVSVVFLLVDVLFRYSPFKNLSDTLETLRNVQPSIKELREEAAESSRLLSSAIVGTRNTSIITNESDIFREAMALVGLTPDNG